MSITSNTRATFTIGGIVVAVIALVSATWRAADAVNGLRSEV